MTHFPSCGYCGGVFFLKNYINSTGKCFLTFFTLSFVVLHILCAFRCFVRAAVDFFDDDDDACRACSIRPVHSSVEYIKGFTIKLK